MPSTRMSNPALEKPGDSVPTCGRRGFTLTEMLVVLGIVLVLTAILIPVVIVAQRKSKVTECQSRLRSLGQALQGYMTENDQTLPPGVTSNSRDSSISPAGLASDKEKKVDVSQGVWRGLVPAQQAEYAKYFAGANGFGYPAPPVAYVIRRWVPINEQNWNCPALRAGRSGQFRSYQFVATDDHHAADDPDRQGNLASGKVGVDEFRPGYMYMSGVEHAWAINRARIDRNRWYIEVSGRYQYEFFASRSISGLQLSEVHPAKRGQQQEDVVTMTDYSTLAHSPKAQLDIYDLAASAPYSANFLYLDGHVETRAFSNLEEYKAQFHAAIGQPW